MMFARLGAADPLEARQAQRHQPGRRVEGNLRGERVDAAVRIKGIVFDKDGTLFDFQRTWGAWAQDLIQAEADGNPALEADLADALGYDLEARCLRSDSIVVACTIEMVAARLLPLLPETTKAELTARIDVRAMSAPQVEAVPLVDLMERLARMGFALGVATNDTEAAARAHLRAAEVEGAFGFIAGCDSGWGDKPGAGQLLAFAHAAELEPAECAMVGDSLHDLTAARTAGMVRVAVLTGLADRETLEPAADVVLTSVADLPAWVAAQA